MTQATINKRPAVTAPARRFAFPTQTAFLSQAALLEEAGPPRVPALVCFLGFAFVVVAILAAMLIEIDVMTSSAGRITAAEGNHVLQSFDGGIVDQVHAEEGQVVERGDLLLTLKDPEAQAQLDRLTVRETAISVQVQRLEMLAGLRSTPPIARVADAEAIIDHQISILHLEQDAMTTEQSLIQAEIDRRSKAIRNLHALEKDASSRFSLTQEKLRTNRRLFAKGLLSKAQLHEVEQEAIDATFDRTELQGQIREAEISLVESKRRLADAIASRKQRQGDQLSSILIDLGETREQIKAMHLRLDRGQIKATARGVVMELKVKHPGQTVAPGDPVIEIIPIDGDLIAETRLLPSEVSHVHEGQLVRVAIDGIEPHRHGYIEGEVEAISPSTFIDENALPYFRASIDLASNHLGAISLTPGMTVQAQIKTGQRTILEYLLKPIYRAWNTSFRER